MKISELPNGPEVARFLRSLRKQTGVAWNVRPRRCPSFTRDDVDKAVLGAWQHGYTLGMMALYGANIIMETHGVESVTIGGRFYDYANAGDAYRLTLMLSHGSFRPYVGNWGDIAERNH